MNQQAKIGFGTSGIMGAAATNRGRIALLEHCFAEGIRHFDTAPLYGVGDAEKVLGKFAKNKRQEIFITSKFGLPAPRFSLLAHSVKPLVRYINRRSSMVSNLIASMRQFRQDGELEVTENDFSSVDLSGRTPSNLYNIDSLEDELDASLQALGTDYLDHYLFHECHGSQLTQELKNKLEEFVRAGKIRNYGIATNPTKTKSILEGDLDLKNIVQTSFDFVTAKTLARSEFEIVIHSIFHSALYKSLIAKNNESIPGLNDLVKIFEIDSASPNSALQICLNFLCSTLPNARVLFSSMDKRKISQTVKTFEGRKPLEESHLDVLGQLLSDNDRD